MPNQQQITVLERMADFAEQRKLWRILLGLWLLGRYLVLDRNRVVPGFLLQPSWRGIYLGDVLLVATAACLFWTGLRRKKS